MSVGAVDAERPEVGMTEVWLQCGHGVSDGFAATERLAVGAADEGDVEGLLVEFAEVLGEGHSLIDARNSFNSDDVNVRVLQ